MCGADVADRVATLLTPEASLFASNKMVASVRSLEPAAPSLRMTTLADIVGV